MSDLDQNVHFGGAGGAIGTPSSRGSQSPTFEEMKAAIRAYLDAAPPRVPKPAEMVPDRFGTGTVAAMFYHLDENNTFGDARQIASGYGYEFLRLFFGEDPMLAWETEVDMPEVVRLAVACEDFCDIWEPTPQGPDWVLANKFDTDNGAVAWFIRPKKGTP